MTTNKQDGAAQPNRLWILYHLFVGYSLNLLIKAIGVFETIFGPPRDYGPTFAFSYAALSALLTVVAVTAGYVGSKILVHRVESQVPHVQLRRLILIALPIAAFLLATIALGAKQAITTTNPPDLAPSEPSNNLEYQVKAFSTTQSGEGFSDGDLNTESLNNISQWMEETTLRKIRENIAARGLQPGSFEPKIERQAMYITIQGKKLGVIKLRLKPYQRMVAVVGFMGTDLTRVTCLRQGDVDIPVWSGPCGNKIREVFGVGLSP